MLPSRSAALYSEVKLASDAALGLPSQVMVAPVAGVGRGAAPRGRLQYCANLGLKINAKLGGVNMRLAGNPDQVRVCVWAQAVLSARSCAFAERACSSASAVRVGLAPWLHVPAERV
jgi:hypothetical protein